MATKNVQSVYVALSCVRDRTKRTVTCILSIPNQSFNVVVVFLKLPLVALISVEHGVYLEKWEQSIINVLNSC